MSTQIIKSDLIYVAVKHECDIAVIKEQITNETRIDKLKEQATKLITLLDKLAIIKAELNS